MLYAILCYNSEDAIGSWSKESGLMGSAIASHLRLGDPLFTHTLFGVWLGLFLWAGLWLRDERVRRFMPVLS